ncbi:MAG TPA: hypothetical protein VMT37_03715 [Solirubrobacterales bacterium]|nr:hypothetical protein [Solirubrobacterales bacterium]
MGCPPTQSATASRAAAYISCRLSHRSGAELWGICKQRPGPIDVAAPAGAYLRRPRIKVHRLASLRPPRVIDEIPVGDPVSILVDLATCLTDEGVEDAVNEADRLRLVGTDRLPALLDARPSRPGTGRLRRNLAAQTFSRSQTALERRFLPIARAAGLPKPTAQAHLGGNRVDFHRPKLGLVVETDSLTYHRTASDQTADLRRDQTHARAGLRT